MAGLFRLGIQRALQHPDIGKGHRRGGAPPLSLFYVCACATDAYQAIRKLDQDTACAGEKVK